MDRSYRRGGLVGPLILVGLGAILLLENLGMLSWNIWEALWRIWPVILIAIGIDLLIGRRSFWGGLAALILILAVFTAGIWLSGVRVVNAGQPYASERVDEALGTAQQAEITLAPAAGALRLHALGSSSALISGTVPTASGERLTRQASIQGAAQVFALRSTGSYTFPFYFGTQPQAWDLGLTTRVPLELTVNMGAGQAELDLRGLQVTDLLVSTGAGQTTVWLPTSGRMTGKMSSGAGQTVIIVPSGVGLRLVVHTALASVQISGAFNYVGIGDRTYTSPGYSSAADRADLDISQAVGSIVVR